MPRTQKLGIIKGNKSISSIITAAGTRKLGPGGLAQFLTEQFPIEARFFLVIPSLKVDHAVRV